MREITFIVTEDESDGGYTAHAHDPDGKYHLFTEGETRDELLGHIREVVETAFDKPDEKPDLIHLQFVRDETISLTKDPAHNGESERYPLRGSVLRFADPLDPACAAEEWEASR